MTVIEQAPADSPQAAYERALASGFVADAAQQRAVLALQHCHVALQRGEQPAGVYLWGPVGRGKTWLMDSFYSSLRVPARRQHFHHFMQWVHRRQFQLTGNADPLRLLAEELGREVRVLCFDELFVSDIGDAMLLGRLLSLVVEQGVVLVTTSNQPPERLYEGATTASASCLPSPRSNSTCRWWRWMATRTIACIPVWLRSAIGCGSRRRWPRPSPA